MSEHDTRPEDQYEKGTAGTGETASLQIDEWGLTGLSALLSFAPNVPFIEFGERRTGRDRRMADRRVVGEALLGE